MNAYKPTASYNLIYVYVIHDESHSGLLKIGKASLSSILSESQLSPCCNELSTTANKRISQQLQTALIKNYELLYTELAIRHFTMADGTKHTQTFEDHDVHDVLYNSNYRAVKFKENGKDSEWFEVGLETAKKAIKAVKSGFSIIVPELDANQTMPTVLPFKPIELRKEQRDNVDKTVGIFATQDTMLWDCKVRYGKTVTAYELSKRLGYTKVIVVTHRPAV
jgi:hypothetical protein